MQRILAFLVLLILPWTVRGQTLAEWYYWFDTDATPRDSGKVTNQQFQLQTDVSYLPTGVHTLYVQVVDTAGVSSPPLGTFFFKVPDISNIDKLFYTIDTEKEAHAVDFGNGTFSLDVSSCSVGFHTINLQVMDKQGGACGVMPYLFYKVPIDGQLSHFRYWFDSDGMVREQPYGQGQYLLDVSGLMPGFHFINFYVNDGENNMTDVQHVGFFRLPVEANQKLHYWFSGDTISTRVDNYREGFLVDVSRLKEGFNTIFFQMEDNGTSDIYSEDFLKVPQTEGVGDMTVLCVIDGKTASEQKLPINGGIIKWDMDVSNIDVGLHKAMFQIVTPSGAGSSIAETYFIRTITDAEVGTMQCSYVIDGFKHYTHKGTQSNGVFHFDLPVDDMEDGLHRIDYMLVADNGATTTQGSAWFLKIPQTENVGDLSVICVIDGKIAAEQELPMYGGVITWDMDVSNIDVGLHKAMFQIVTPSGAGSSIAETYFIRTITDVEVGTMQCSYVIDGFKHYTHKGTQSNGVFHFDLPLDDMEDGLHRIDYMLVADNGVTTTQGSAWFFKTPVGGNGITQYDYWLNSKSDEVQSVTLATPTNPFNLISLLPVTAEPIRSSCFHFDFKDGQPMMYAKNDIHFRFHDKSGRWVDADNQYVDYNVSQEVQPLGELLATQTFPMIEKDSIRWYTLNAEAGDSLTFKASQATSIQLFSPKGEELYFASSSESVVYDGCHTWETGTHYLAVHDVTGSRPNMTLDYEHIDKYAILSHTPDVAGNVFGNQFKMHLVGNGLDKLIDASLVHGYQTILMDSIVQQSISKANIRFVIDKDSYAMGTYDLHLYYVDEIGKKDSLTIVEAITLEEALYADVKVDIVDRSTMAKPFPISVVLKNEGNMSYSYIPLNIALDNPLEISDIRFHNFYATVAMENDTVGYQPIVLTENLLGKGVDGAVMFFYIPELGAKETLDLQLDFTAPAHTRFKMYAWTGTPLELDTLMLQAQHSPTLHKANTSNRGQNIITFGDAVQEVTGLDVMPQNVQHAGQLANVIMKTGVTIGSMQNAMGRTIGNSYADAYNVDDDTRQLIKEAYEELYPEVLTPGQIIGGDFGDLVDRLMGFQRECSRNPDPDPGTPHNAHIVVPHDPNDIYGYQSPSGTMFIADSVANVMYTIEFENDTTFATAAAHTIVIKDSLDNRYFDLSNFMPTGIKIGEHEAFLNENDVVTKNNKTTFVKTIDMRPKINAIAQVDGTFSHTTGIAEWRFTSLDPMTMEPTDDLMQGILPVNYNGTSGIGEVLFEIGMKQGKADGTEIKNRAGIVFDYEEAILTPTWTNIVDAVAPSSIIDNSWMVNDSTLRITADGFDARSGVWKYTWYVQAGENAPWWKEGETDSCSFDYHIYEGIDYGFCVLATDSAGNVEQKVIQRERGFKTYGPDYEDNISPVLTSPEVEEPVYDLSGRQIGNGKSSNGNYPKGVIIRNRRKTLVTE